MRESLRRIFRSKFHLASLTFLIKNTIDEILTANAYFFDDISSCLIFVSV